MLRAMPRFKTSREALWVASTERDIKHLLRDALGQMTPEELASLPHEARFAMIDREPDVHTAAVALLQCDLKHREEGDGAQLLRQVAELYASASVRLSQLQHRFGTAE
jgi:hypothetical protein